MITTKTKILIVDDENPIRELLRLYFEKEQFEVLEAENGAQAMTIFEEKKPDIIILDIMMPIMDGLEVCQQIRKNDMTPLILLTAKGEDEDRILGLEIGADDYITKPFNILEVKARIKAIMRRVDVSSPPKEEVKVISSGDILLDCDSRQVKINDKNINLTAKEFDLLELFVTHPSKVYSREALLELIWGVDYPGDLRTVDVHVRRLREKIEPNPSDPRYVHTKWGAGYYYQG